jgi:hypothetical protein
MTLRASIRTPAPRQFFALDFLREPQRLGGPCQSKLYIACLRLRAGQSSTVFPHESPTRSAGFGAENGLYLFALTMPVLCPAANQGTLLADIENEQERINGCGRVFA